MKLKEKMQEISKLEIVETPWKVMRVFGKLEIFGSQISVFSNGDNDYVDLQEFRDALSWLVDQSGGYIIWDESVKKGKKK